MSGLDIIQGSPEWYAIRLGKVTASRIPDLTARIKSGYGASRANYMAELVCERLTGVPGDSYKSAAMEWGNTHEDDARDLYQFMEDCEVTRVGFVPHPRIAMSGASPDSFAGNDGLVEIKCPLTATHIETLRGGSIPGKYIKQVQWQMTCTGRAWCDWVSYDPRLPASMRLFVQRIQRDDAVIAELEKEVIDFLAELDATIADLRARYENKAAA